MTRRRRWYRPLLERGARQFRCGPNRAVLGGHFRLDPRHERRAGSRLAIWCAQRTFVLSSDPPGEGRMNVLVGLGLGGSHVDPRASARIGAPAWGAPQLLRDLELR